LRSANARGQRRSNLAPVNAEQAGSGSAPIQNAQIRALRGRHPHAPVGRTERRVGARYQELIARLVNPTTADQPGGRPYIYALPLLARTPASAAYRASSSKM
jgi:hypothetical protein